ncbi:nucleoid-associated protein [Sulfurirhabdus autotrophica]|uniref:Nucleoid associated protein NdpA n=1 Tax=Sulfurirhabdus autotrophica TaxID=1706046 RepID=A0A4R3XTY5_9PROT|nr:nucleoid-associated protein [Sulfurirhabdus autotrophica]TCV82686.1 nucleoid associated protein NdpA [Sulfurirhabdus autotrophica]
MHLLNFNVDRIIIHQVYRRDPDGNKIVPTQSHEFTNFEQSAMQEFKSRVKDAIGEGSKAVQMEIVNQETNDLPTLVDQLIDKDNVGFAVSSYDIAKKLTEAQQTKSIPGGIVVIFSGTQGSHSKRFLGIIKAEVHSGYEKEINPKTNEISLKFVEELLLTPGTRLYKTAGFFEKFDHNGISENLNDKWIVMVSDYQISKAEGKAAAHYFYSDFLGCGYPETSARTTKQFYESTRLFISEMNATEERKSSLLNALTTYLKVETSSTISSSDFAEKYLDDIDLQDTFTAYMKSTGLPDNAFTKDIEHIEKQLQFRKVNFRSNVKITAPSDVFKDLVIIESIDGDIDASGSPAEWTKVIIKDRIIKQE